MNLDNKLKKVYNYLTKIKLYKKIFFFCYLIFLLFSIIFFTFAFKYPLRKGLLKKNSLPKIERTMLNLDSLNKLTSGHFNNYYQVAKDSNTELVYNQETDSVGIQKINSDNSLDFFETNAYRLVAKKAGIPEANIMDFYNTQKETYSSLFANFSFNIKYSSAPEENSITFYSTQAYKKDYSLLKNGNGFIINYYFKSDKYDKSLFPDKINREQREKLISKIKKFFGNSATSYQPYVSLLRYYRQKTLNRNALYYLEYPQKDIDQFIKDLYFIWYDIYKLTDKELISFNVGKRINKYEFIIPVMYELASGSFKTSILTNEIKENSLVVDNSKWVITKFNLNPNFLGVSYDDELENILVPDGSGALIDAKLTKEPYFHGHIYQNDFYLRNANDTKDEPVVKLPLMGISMASNDEHNKNTTGVLLNVTSGYNQASLTVETKLIRQAYAIFDYRYIANTQFVSGEERYSLANKYDDDLLSLTYHFISRKNESDHKPLSYLDFANLYEELYLSHLDKLSRSPEIAIEFLNSIIKKEHFLGIPYQKQISLTTFEEAEKIKEIFKDISKTYFYRNWQTNGLNSEIPTKHLKTFRKLGNKPTGDNNYFLTNFIKTIYDSYKNFRNTENGMVTVKNEIRKNYELDLITNKYEQIKDNRYYLLSPKYYLDLADRFKVKNPDFRNVALTDLGMLPTTELSDLNYSPKMVEEIKKYVINSLSNLALNNPYLNMLPNKAVIYDSMPYSTGAKSYKSTVPFYETLLSKFYRVYLTSSNVSNLYESSYYVLYSLLSGANPKYTLTYLSSEITKKTNYNKFYSTKYDIYKEEINHYSNVIKAFYENYGTELIDVEVISNNIFLARFKKDSEISKILFNLNQAGYTYNENGNDYYINGLDVRKIQ